MYRVTAFSLILLASCSIIEDSDITSNAELRLLHLQKMTMAQSLNSGVFIKTISPIDSAMDISFSLGKLTKQTKIPWGDVQASDKLRFRSGATSNITIVNRYFDNGNIRSCNIYSGSVIREQYYFVYNSRGNLITLTTNLKTDPNDLTKTINTYDTINYDGNSNYFGFALRMSPQSNQRGAFTTNPLDTSPCVYKWVFTPFNGDPAKQYGWCGNNNFYIYPGGQNADFYSTGNDLVEEIYLADRITDNDRKCCADIYYYHPILFHSFDIRYKIMYAHDWWEEREPTTQGNKNESIQIKFEYGL